MGECKPMLFKEGAMIEFLTSKKSIKQPRFKTGFLANECLAKESSTVEVGEAERPGTNCFRNRLRTDSGFGMPMMPLEMSSACPQSMSPFMPPSDVHLIKSPRWADMLGDDDNCSTAAPSETSDAHGWFLDLAKSTRWADMVDDDDDFM